MLKAGLVGLPNVGKSTLFNALIGNRKAEAANYPFCTIEPNQGLVTVPDDRLQQLSNLSNSEKIIPTTIEFVDIAGLVEGAAEGAGLGNKFLSHIREVDLIVQVVRCFDNSDIIHELGSVNPVRDIEIIVSELILADLAVLEKRRENRAKKAKRNDQLAQREVALMDKIIPVMADGFSALQVVAKLSLNEEEQSLLASFYLLSYKQIVFACNVAEDELGRVQADPNTSDYVQQVQQYIIKNDLGNLVIISAKIEEELSDLDSAEKAEFLAEMAVADSGVSQLICEVYRSLNLLTFITTGEIETRAWTISAGMKAPQAAGAIHTDFEQKFIRAEVISYQDYIAAGSLSEARKKGVLRAEGKDYFVQDGDVIHFLTGA